MELTEVLFGLIGLMVGLVCGALYRAGAVRAMGRCKECDLARSCPKCHKISLYT